MKFSDEMAPGDCIEIGSYHFTADEIREFANAYDPQPFHVDEEAARNSAFGGLCASGWHTMSAWMRTFYDHYLREKAANDATGRPTPQTGPSPGFRDLKWLRPVYAGETIDFRSTVVEVRHSASRPQWGIVRMHHEGFNPSGDKVMEFTSTYFLEWRDRAN